MGMNRVAMVTVGGVKEEEQKEKNRHKGFRVPITMEM